MRPKPGPGAFRAEGFRVVDTALQATQTRRGLHQLERIHMIVIHEPFQLRGVTAQHLFLPRECFRDIDIFDGLEVGAGQGIEVHQGRHPGVRRKTGLYVWQPCHERCVEHELARGAMIRMVVFRGMS